MLKIIAGLVAGFAVALASIYVIWLVGLQIYPLPPASGSAGLERWGELIPTLPTGAQLFIVLSWFGGAFLGTLTAIQVSRRYWPGWIIAAFVGCTAIANIFEYAIPDWMQIAAVVVPIAGAVLASHAAKRSLRGAPLNDIAADG